MEAAPPDAVAASTVILARDGGSGVQVYLQRRPRSMPFAADRWAYPGGRVEPADADPAIDACWIGPPPAAWSDRLGVGVATARAHVVAAIRETLEETGVLLGGGWPTRAAVTHARGELLDGAASFAAVASRHGLRVDSRLLRYWAWWVTPVGAPRRYDTRFFLARMPADAVIVAHGVEVADERWVSADEIDGLAMLPPTARTLREVAGHPTVSTALASATRRRVTRVLPRLEDGTVRLPWDGDRTP